VILTSYEMSAVRNTCGAFALSLAILILLFPLFVDTFTAM